MWKVHNLWDYRVNAGFATQLEAYVVDPLTNTQNVYTLTFPFLQEFFSTPDPIFAKVHITKKGTLWFPSSNWELLYNIRTGRPTYLYWNLCQLSWPKTMKNSWYFGYLSHFGEKVHCFFTEPIPWESTIHMRTIFDCWTSPPIGLSLYLHLRLVANSTLGRQSQRRNREWTGKILLQI